MIISKFLMNVAVCAVSIGGVSTSYGANLEQFLKDTPVRPTAESDASLTSSRLQSLERFAPDDDRSETGSIGSNFSNINHERLNKAMDSLIGLLHTVPEDVTFPGDAEGATPESVNKSKVHFIKYALGNLVKAYNKLAADHSTQTAELDAMTVDIGRVTAELAELKSKQAETDVEIKGLNAANSTHVELKIDTTPEEARAAKVIKSRNIGSSKWTYVAGGAAAGAGVVIIGKLIFDNWPAITAKVFGR